MILPCRIHRAGNRNRVDSLPLALLFAAFLLVSTTRTHLESRRSGFDVRTGWFGLAAGYSNSNHGRCGHRLRRQRYSRARIGESFSVHHRKCCPHLRSPWRTDGNFFDWCWTLYQNFDVTGQNETAGNVTMSLTHNFSTRLSFYASIYATYQNEPNFQSNVGPENVRTHFFDTRDIFSLTYRWSSRLYLGNKLHVRARQVRSVVDWKYSRPDRQHISASSLYLT